MKRKKTEATVGRISHEDRRRSTAVYILIVCCFIVAMPSGKRETERKGNAPVNTGPSPNSDGRANNMVEEADEPARGSGPLQ
ncbi:hypothetical protein T01_2600 [Trichinella spiralis]|uniref:Uncharacterized protein n=1 Tax=Trichinella spiralis TaxID=6334 RepID=A0A0V1BNH9_TRISP|nr:hypothetical protein T01_2600 [Trichinella spiralis]